MRNRWVRRSLVGAAALLIMFVTGLWWLVSTNRGLQTAMSFALGRIENPPVIGSMTGRLRGPFVLRDVTIQTETLTAAADSVRVDWDLLPLLQRRANLRSLHIGATDIVMREAGPLPDTTPSVVVALPVTLRLDTVLIGPIRFTRDSLTIIVDRTVISNLTGRDQVSVERIQSILAQTSVTLSGSVVLSETFPVTGHVSWSHHRNGVQYAGRGSISGDTDSLHAEHVLSLPIDARVSGEAGDLLSSRWFHATVDVPEFDLARVLADAAPRRMGFNGTVRGNPDTVFATASVAVRDETIGSTLSNIVARLTPGTLTIDSMVTSFPNRQGRLAASGTSTLDGNPVFSMDLRWSGLGWPLTDRVAAVRSTGNGRLSGGDGQFVLNASGSLTGSRGGPQQFRAASEGTAEASTVTMTVTGTSGTLAASGDVTWKPEVSWRATVRGDSLDPRTFTTDSTFMVQAVHFVATTAGRWTKSLTGNLNIQEGAATVTEVPLRFTGGSSFTATEFRFDRTTVEGLGGTAVLTGAVDWSGAARWDVTADIRDISPDELAGLAQWPGSVSARTRVQGSAVGGAFNTTIALDTVFGELGGAFVNGRGVVATLGDSINMLDLSLRWGQSSLTARGFLRDRLDLRLDADVPDLSVPLPEGAGRISALVHITGDRAGPAVAVNLAAFDLLYRDLQINNVSADGAIDLAAGGAFEFRGDAYDAVYRGTVYDTARVVVSGVREAHTISAGVFQPEARLVALAEGALLGENWFGTIRRLSGSQSELGEWLLLDTARVMAGRDSIRLHPVCVHNAEARVCASGARTSDGAWDTSALFAGLSLHSLGRFGRLTIPVEGTAQGHFTLAADTTGQLTGGGTAQADGTGMFTLSPAAETVVLESPALNWTIDTRGVNASMQANARKTTVPDSALASITATLAMPFYRRLSDSLRNQTYSGRISAEVPDLAILDIASRHVENTRGSLTMDVTLDGTVETFQLRGSGALTNFSTRLPQLGIDIEDGQLTATGNDSGFILAGNMRSGPGVVGLSGRAGRRTVTDTVLTLRVQGTDFRTLSTPEAVIRTSPDLTVQLVNQQILVDGTVAVPFAAMEFREVPTTGIVSSPDVLFLDDSNTVNRQPLNISSRVRVTLGDSVSFKGFGLTASPKGSILVVEEPGRARTATGQLAVDGGRYRAYGQELAIQTGRINYAGGPLDDPGLEVRATRRITTDTLAGVEVSGTLREPVVAVFSEPSMVQGDALAYLMFGRPIREITSGESTTLAGAARSLGLSQGNLLTQRLGRQFGLDEARIDTERSWQQASFVAGKYLSPKMFISYTVGLFEPRDIVRLRYALSSKWTLQAETGDGTTTDIRYRLQRSRSR